MSTVTKKKRDIKYLGKDFEGFKDSLVEHLKVYFPNNYKDFSESSSAMMLVEMAAFIGDNLSFYLDKKFNESFLETANERVNIFRHAKQLGFKSFGKTPAIGEVDAFLKVPARIVNQESVPDMRYAGIIKIGASLAGGAGQTYETLDEIDFSKVNTKDPNYTVVSDTDPTTGAPSYFALRVPNVQIKAGKTKTTTISVGSYEAFKKIAIPDTDVIEIISIKDSEGNKWYEVDYLAQDTIFDSVSNTNADSGDVPYVLKLRSVPYRFITEYDVETGTFYCIFGSGDTNSFDGDLIPNVGDLSLPLYGKSSFTGFSLDPQNFLKTRGLGLAPTNTTLTISYRVGGGEETNAGTGQISNVGSKIFEVSDSSLNSSVISTVEGSFDVYNPLPVQGGKDELSIDEIKQLISNWYAAQNRLVTVPDFIARTLSMPARYGSIFRANAKQSSINKNAVELYVVSKDANGFVTTAPQSLKENLRTYLGKFRMMTDAIEIMDGEVIDIGLNFSILCEPDYNKNEVLAKCISDLKDFFDIDKWQLNQPINLIEVEKVILNVPGVLSIYNLYATNKTGVLDGRQYSSVSWNPQQNRKYSIYYGKENAIFQVRYPNKDIVGTVL